MLDMPPPRHYESKRVCTSSVDETQTEGCAEPVQVPMGLSHAIWLPNGYRDIVHPFLDQFALIVYKFPRDSIDESFIIVFGKLQSVPSVDRQIMSAIRLSNSRPRSHHLARQTNIRVLFSADTLATTSPIFHGDRDSG